MSHKGYIRTCDLTFPFFPKSFDQYYIERADFECFFGHIPCQPLSIIALGGSCWLELDLTLDIFSFIPPR